MIEVVTASTVGFIRPCTRSERRLSANSVEKHRVAVAEISVFN